MAPTLVAHSKSRGKILNKAKPTLIKFGLSPAKRNELRALNIKDKLQLELPNTEWVDLEILEKEYNRLCEIEIGLKDPRKRRLLQKYKITILEAFEKHLDKKVLGEKSKEEKEPESRLLHWSKRIAYSILALTGLVILDATVAFFGVYEMLTTFVSAISSPLAMGISVFLCLFNSYIFYVDDTNSLRKAMGIESALSRYDLDEIEIEATRRVNKKLSKGQKSLSASEYSALTSFAGSFNKNITQKNEQYLQEPKENTLQWILRCGVTLCSSIVQLSSAYFLASSLLTFFAIGLVGTPIGWGIIGFGMLTYLSFFLATRGEVLRNMFNPEKEKFNLIKDKLDSFEPNPDFVKKYDTKKVKTTLESHLANRAKGSAKKDPELPALVKASHEDGTWKSSSGFAKLNHGQALWKKIAPNRWLEEGAVKPKKHRSYSFS